MPFIVVDGRPQWVPASAAPTVAPVAQPARFAAEPRAGDFMLRTNSNEAEPAPDPVVAAPTSGAPVVAPVSRVSRPTGGEARTRTGQFLQRPGVRSFASDFAGGFGTFDSRMTRGEAFAQGFAGAMGSSQQRRSAEAEAAAAAEREAYERALDEDERNYNRSQDAISNTRSAEEAARAARAEARDVEAHGLAMQQAEVDLLTDAAEFEAAYAVAERSLPPEDIRWIREETRAWIAREESLIESNGFLTDEQQQDIRTRAEAYQLEITREMLDARGIEVPASTVTAATGAPAPTDPGAPATVGTGSTATDPIRNATQAVLDALGPGTWYILDPTDGIVKEFTVHPPITPSATTPPMGIRGNAW